MAAVAVGVIISDPSLGLFGENVDWNVYFHSEKMYIVGIRYVDELKVSLQRKICNVRHDGVKINAKITMCKMER